MKVSFSILTASVILLVSFSTAHAAFIDGFEADTVGTFPHVSAPWRPSGSAAQAARVSDAQAHTGSQSLFIPIITGGEERLTASSEADKLGAGTIKFSYYLVDNPSGTIEGFLFNMYSESAATPGTRQTLDIQVRFRNGEGINVFTAGKGVIADSVPLITLNTWHDVVIDFDYATDLFSLSLDGNHYTNLNMGGTNTTDHSFQYALAMENSRGQIYFDDINISVPEPASVALMGLGVVSMFARRRRR